MSRYVRDDKTFREQIQKLTDSGLNLHVGQNCLPTQPKTHGKLFNFAANVLATLVVALIASAIFAAITWGVMWLLGAL